MEQTADEIRRLQGWINDLLSALALPAMWSDHESAQIVSTLLDVLVGMLHLDFAYARLNEPVDEGPIELVRLAQSRNLTARPQEIGQMLTPWLGDDPQKWPLLVRNPLGDGDVSIVPLRLGLRGEIGVIVAGSQRADFPKETERLLLGVAANQAAIALQEARLLSEQKRFCRRMMKFSVPFACITPKSEARTAAIFDCLRTRDTSPSLRLRGNEHRRRSRRHSRRSRRRKLFSVAPGGFQNPSLRECRPQVSPHKGGAIASKNSGQKGMEMIVASGLWNSALDIVRETNTQKQILTDNIEG